MLPWPKFATFASAVASRAHGAGPGRSTQARRTGSRAGTRGHGRAHPNWLPGARRRARQRARCGRVQGAVARVRSRVRRLRRVCGQELRLVQLCSSHERSGQKLLAVQLPRGCLRFCMAVAPTARCRVMLNSLSSRSTPEPRVGAACAGFPGPCHQGHPCSWPAGEHQVWRSASSGHASRRPQNGESSDLVSSGRGRAASRPAAAWNTVGKTWP
jgi:hypothetical protein